MSEPARQSYWSLNALNFLLAQIAAVVVPFLSVYLRHQEWRYDLIGYALATAGIGSLLFQIPAGVICDFITKRKLLLASTALLLGLCYLAIPLFVSHVVIVFLLLLISGFAGTFFAPLLSSLALRMVGHDHFDKLTGKNRFWSHAGAMTAALITLVVVPFYGIEPLFLIAGSFGLLAAACTFLIRSKDLKFPIHPRTAGKSILTWKSFKASVEKLASISLTRIFIAMLIFYHIANGASASLVSLFLMATGGTDAHVAWLVVVPQPITMVASWFSGKMIANIGRKPILLLAVGLLFVRLAAYNFVHDPMSVLAVTALDGLSSGVITVLVIVICGDLTRKTGHFNLLMGALFTLPALGGFAGGALKGVLLEIFDFRLAFAVFSMIALVSFVIGFVGFKETKPIASS